MRMQACIRCGNAKIAQLVEHNLAPRNKKGKTNLGKGDRDTGSESEIDRMRK